MSQASEHADPAPFRYWATVILLVVNGIAFGIQKAAYLYAPHFPFDDYFALSLDGIRRGYFWQLLTFQFMHGSLLHIVLNSWFIFIFGRIVEVSIGWRQMIRLYLLSGVIGGMTQIVGMWVFPSLLGNVGVVGASAGAAGLAAAFAVLYPNEILVMLIPVPVRMRAWTFMWFIIVFSMVGILYPLLENFVPPFLRYYTGMLFNGVAHAGHLGGILGGWALARRFIRRRRRPAPPVIEPQKTTLNATPAAD